MCDPCACGGAEARAGMEPHCHLTGAESLIALHIHRERVAIFVPLFHHYRQRPTIQKFCTSHPHHQNHNLVQDDRRVIYIRPTQIVY